MSTTARLQCPDRLKARIVRTGEQSGRESSARSGRDLGKGWCVADSQIGQHLAIDGHAGSIQALNQAAIGQAIKPGGRINADDPEATHVALEIVAITVLILKGLHDRLVGDAKMAVTRRNIPLGRLEHLLVPGM